MKCLFLLSLLTIVSVFAAGESYYGKHPDIYAISKKDCIMEPEHLGLINGIITARGDVRDVAHVRGLYSPPFFSGNFDLAVTFNGSCKSGQDYTWRPEVLHRMSRDELWQYDTWLVPLAGKRAVMLKVRVQNMSASEAEMEVAVCVSAWLGKKYHWGFDVPHDEIAASSIFRNGNIMYLETPACTAGVSVSLPIAQVIDGKFTARKMRLAPGAKNEFFILMALGQANETRAIIGKYSKDWQKSIDKAIKNWKRRVDGLYGKFPVFESDNATLVRLYNRSLLHFLLNEWNVPEFMLHPYYSTGSINGGCTCCYLWNFGEPFRMWPFLGGDVAKSHIRAYLQIDLKKCYAFFPEDGTHTGAYYPVNQEKIIFLVHSYVMESGDVAFLTESFKGKQIIELLVDQALMHDDISKPVCPVSYGHNGSHLELRGKHQYGGTVPDLNLRRCVNMQLVQQLCDLCGHKPPVNLAERSAALKQSIHDRLFDQQAGWFRALDTKNQPYLRYTMQILKAMGWNNWAMSREDEAALLAHIMNPEEFLGNYGLHSMSKKDPAYDDADIDNAGPGACISFTPAIIDRLYMAGYYQEGDDILTRLYWLADHMPYWGDSHRADRMEYRHDTPLQNDIQGTTIAQTIIFGLFGIDIKQDFTVDFKPHLPPGTRHIALKDLKLAGKIYDVDYTDGKLTVNKR